MLEVIYVREQTKKWTEKLWYFSFVYFSSSSSSVSYQILSVLSCLVVTMVGMREKVYRREVDRDDQLIIQNIPSDTRTRVVSININKIETSRQIYSVGSDKNSHIWWNTCRPLLSHEA